jgi:hypothetical protein
MRLDNIEIKGWKDLVSAFIKQCKFTINVTSDRSSLQDMKMDDRESIQEYTKSWLGVATQVDPPLLEKKMEDGQFVYQHY